MPPGGSGIAPPPIMQVPPPGMRAPPPVVLPNALNNFPNQPIPPRQTWNPPPPVVDINKGPAVPQSLANDINSNGNIENTENGDGAEDNKEKKPAEVVLPKALEDVLALKDQRAAEFNINSEDFGNTDASNQLVNDYDAGDDSEEEGDIQTNGGVAPKPGKLSKVEKNKKKKRRKKLNKRLKKQQEQSRGEDHNKDGEQEEDAEEVPEESKKSKELNDETGVGKRGEKSKNKKDYEKFSTEQGVSTASENDVTIE